MTFGHDSARGVASSVGALLQILPLHYPTAALLHDWLQISETGANSPQLNRARAAMYFQRFTVHQPLKTIDKGLGRTLSVRQSVIGQFAVRSRGRERGAIS